MRIKLTVALLALFLLAAVPPSLSLGPAQSDTYPITANRTYLPAGQSLTIMYTVTNNGDLSVDKVNITLPIASEITGIEARVYNETGSFQGTWSYEEKTTSDGTPVLVAYTSSLPLQTGYTLVVNVTLTTLSSAGEYGVVVDIYHRTETGGFTLLYSETIGTVIDAVAPSITASSSYVREQDGLYTLPATITDTIDGSAPGQLDPGSLALSPVTWHDAENNTDNTITDYTYAFDPSSGSLTITINNDNLKSSLGYGVKSGDTLTVTVTISDLAGNTASETLTYTVDNDPPTLQVYGVYTSLESTSPPSGAEAYQDEGGNYWVKEGGTVYIALEYGDNIGVTGYTVEGVDSYTVTDTGQYLIVTVESVQDTISPVITVSDGAGNTASKTLTVSPDGSEPVMGASIGSTTLNPGEWYRAGSASSTLTVDVADTGSGVGSVTYTVEAYSSMYAYQNGEEPSSTTSGSLATTGGDISLAEPGVYIVTVTAEDNVGNSVSQTYMIVNDADAPSVTVEYQTMTEADGTYYVNSNSLTVALTVSDMDNVTVRIILDEQTLKEYTIEAPNPSGEQWSYTIDLSGYSDGAHTLVVTVVDASGNPYSESRSFVLDRSPPQADSEASTLDDINGEILDPNNDTLSGLSMTFTDSPAGFTSGVATVEVYFDGSPLVEGTDYSVSIPDSGTLTVTVSSDAFWSSATDGEHTITLSVTDNAGNTATESISFQVDKTPPTITSVTIADEATGNTEYTSGNVKIVLEASDNIQISDTVTVELYEEGGAEPVHTWVLTGTVTDGTSLSLEWTIDAGSYMAEGVQYTIVVKVSDTKSHAAASSSTIQLDSWPPTITYNGDDITGSEVDLGCVPGVGTIQLTITDTGLGVASVTVTMNGDAYSNTSWDPETGALEIYTNGIPDGVYTFTVTATDKAGKTSTATITFSLDTTPPSVEMASSQVTGGIELSGVSLSDATGVTGFDISVIVNGENTTVSGLDPSLLQGMHVINMSSGETANAYTFEGLQTLVGQHYARMANPDDPVDYPVVVIINGTIYVIPGLYSDTVSVEVKIVAHDCAGNAGASTASYDAVPAGQFVLSKLYPGWNLVSLPVMSSDLKTSEYVSWIRGDGQVSAIYIYDKENGTWLDPYIPGFSTNDYTLKDGMAFWVKYQPAEGEDNGVIVVEQGYLPYTTPPGGTPPGFVEYYLTKGGNFLGFTSAAPLPVSYYLSYLNETGMIYEWVYVFNARSQAWNVVSLEDNPNYMLYPGSAMWVIVYQDTPFNVLPWYSYYLSGGSGATP